MYCGVMSLRAAENGEAIPREKETASSRLPGLIAVLTIAVVLSVFTPSSPWKVSL